jgi:repressor LexA
MKLVGFRSRASVFKLIERFILQGTIEKDAKGKLLPQKDWGTIPLLGLVDAGFPSPQEEYRSDSMNLDEYLVPKRDASYVLKVKGDSMKDAGIIDGDLVVAERTHDARPGNIVIARIDGAYTMKYYRLKNGKPYLEPANSHYRPMFPRESFEIEAVVKAVVRKYP